jgi:hypothetical protein
MARGGHGLPKVSPGPTMPYHSMLCRRTTRVTALQPFQGWPAHRVVLRLSSTPLDTPCRTPMCPGDGFLHERDVGRHRGANSGANSGVQVLLQVGREHGRWRWGLRGPWTPQCKVSLQSGMPTVSMPCGRSTSGRLLGRLWVGFPQGIEW